MKNLVYKRLMIMVLLISMSITVIFAEDIDFGSVEDNAMRNARNDARKDTNSALWFGAGCMLSFWGIAGAYLILPSPKIKSILGKSSEYVAVYTDEYKSEAKRIQTKYAMEGCIASGVAYGIYSLMIMFVPYTYY